MKVATLTAQTLAPLGAIAVVAVAVGSAAVWLNVKLAGLDGQIEMLRQDVRRLTDEVRKEDHRDVTVAEFRAWLAGLRAANPSIQIPSFDVLR